MCVACVACVLCAMCCVLCDACVLRVLRCAAYVAWAVCCVLRVCGVCCVCAACVCVCVLCAACCVCCVCVACVISVCCVCAACVLRVCCVREMSMSAWLCEWVHHYIVYVLCMCVSIRACITPVLYVIIPLSLFGALCTLATHGRTTPLTIVGPVGIRHMMETVFAISGGFMSYELRWGAC